MPAVNVQVIKDRRTSLHLEPETIAERCRLTTSGYINIEAGRALPSVEIAYRLAAQLRLKPPQLSPDLIDPAAARTIRERRRVRGIKVSELAGTLGVSVQHLMNVEAGIRNPGPGMLAGLAKALRCESAELTSRTSA
jgi:transcriptional regulator with XRE-family HTH domain